MRLWRKASSPGVFQPSIGSSWEKRRVALKAMIKELESDLEHLQRGDPNFLRLTVAESPSRLARVAQSWNSVPMFGASMPVEMPVTSGEALAARTREVEKLLGQRRAELARHMANRPGDDIIGV